MANDNRPPKRRGSSRSARVTAVNGRKVTAPLPPALFRELCSIAACGPQGAVADHLEREETILGAVLDRLLRDQRMAGVWQTFQRHWAKRRSPRKLRWNGRTAEPSDLFLDILEAIVLAARMREYREERDKIDADRRQRCNWAEQLARYFEGTLRGSEEGLALLHLPEPESRKLHEYACEFQEKARAAITSFRWAADFLRRPFLAFIEELPNSRKRDPILTFCLMVAKKMEDLIGQPLYAQVATIAEVVFDPDPVPDAQAIRLAYHRDRSRHIG